MHVPVLLLGSTAEVKEQCLGLSQLSDPKFAVQLPAALQAKHKPEPCSAENLTQDESMYFGVG